MLIPFEDSLSFRKKICKYNRPLFLFDDDADGVCSFLLFYKYFDDGAGVIVKGNPEVQESYLNKIIEFRPDCIIILDKPLVSEGFFEGTNLPIFWLDHHDVQRPQNVSYLNPRLYDPNVASSTSSLVWELLSTDESFNKEDYEWLFRVGALSDWDEAALKDISKDLKEVIGKDISAIEEGLFESKFGSVINLINFNLKGRKHEAMKSVKCLNEINNFQELLDGETEPSKFLNKKYSEVNKEYELIKSSVSVDPQKKVLAFTYHSDVASITAELSNELLHLHPDKIILVARAHKNRYLCSIRSKDIDIADTISGTASKYGGYGGGHKNACGASIPVDYFDLFVEELTGLFSDV